MMELTDDSRVIIDFFCGRGSIQNGQPCGRGAARGLLGDLRSSLMHQGQRANAVARSLGFVNAEHEALAFITSPMFRLIVVAFLRSRRTWDDSPGYCATWRDFGQALLNQRYRGTVLLDTEGEIADTPPPLRRRSTKPHDGKEYPPIGDNGQGSLTVLEILEQYDGIVRREERDRRMRQ